MGNSLCVSRPAQPQGFSECPVVVARGGGWDLGTLEGSTLSFLLAPFLEDSAQLCLELAERNHSTRPQQLEARHPGFGFPALSTGDLCAFGGGPENSVVSVFTGPLTFSMPGTEDWMVLCQGTTLHPCLDGIGL